MEPIFLVEGNNDENVLRHLSRIHGIINNIKDIHVDPCEGLPDLLNLIPVRVKANPPSLGIIVDANADIQTRWKELSTILSAHGYFLPDVPEKQGTIVRQNNLPLLGIWLMPDNQSNGMLENFLITMVPAEDKLFPIADRTLTEIEQKPELIRYPLHKHSKALVHTWLAWQQKPGLPFGTAIAEHYFNTDNELVKQFLEWVKKLFTQTQL